MKKLLFLVHRLPYPPNKGDKISSYNILKYLSQHWRVHLGTFIDDPDDWQYTDTVKAMCENSCFVGLKNSTKAAAIMKGFFRGTSFTEAFYNNKDLLSWVSSDIDSEAPDAIFIYSGAMGQYLPSAVPASTRIVFNCEDVDSEKWRNYSHAKVWPLSYIYGREANKLLTFERAIATRSHVTSFISEAEANLFKKRAPECAHKTHYRLQGVDAAYFDPELNFSNPYTTSEKAFVFTGVMDYLPNIDAVVWFCERVVPALFKIDPDFRFYIVGMKPTDRVLELARHPAVAVTGAVDDVRPYLKYAWCACLPLQIARGIQNKALEAMAMALPVVATRDALVGINCQHLEDVHAADSSSEMIEECCRILAAPRKYCQPTRTMIDNHYDWPSNLAKLAKFLE
ncbi:TIGR03087 family PEP-CTERM/XrtA system glycosyltransferase [Halieaceae bacterium IMCC14734]|uniref:TIGR03087 family PEP-CTERM/XrtA system glycosyltransferase n=1 Tax=Candidatus Litorirhabdus singularis TaxID=2518993 RepID=A0ABT3TG86_9GAMM|nr:TIGR03087 family PEP-CTERM/XrtA system glycosyltransferase [Candidatus Litorirhabdus singularis]MCX2981322.1 TIGR03087 family PEP-CTERM/XrtA system glycosyltransferase [Candidatus Litorirhabdus singularis]